MRSILYLLQDLQFTESEAKVYLTLLENGPCTGYETSRLSGVASSKIYGILENLLQRGAITSSSGEKNRLYRAEPASTLSQVIRCRMDAILEQLELEAHKLSTPAADEQIWQVCDWFAVRALSLEMLQRAEKEISIQIWANELDTEIEDTIVKRQQKLEHVTVILYDEKGQYDTHIPRFYKHGFELDKLQEMGGRWFLVEIDDHEMLYAAFSGNELAEAFHTRNRYMAMFAREYVYHDAYSLRLINHLREDVMSEFGKNMEGVRGIFSL